MIDWLEANGFSTTVRLLLVWLIIDNSGRGCSSLQADSAETAVHLVSQPIVGTIFLPPSFSFFSCENNTPIATVLAGHFLAANYENCFNKVVF